MDGNANTVPAKTRSVTDSHSFSASHLVTVSPQLTVETQSEFKKSNQIWNEIGLCDYLSFHVSGLLTVPHFSTPPDLCLSCRSPVTRRCLSNLGHSLLGAITPEFNAHFILSAVQLRLNSHKILLPEPGLAAKSGLAEKSDMCPASETESLSDLEESIMNEWKMDGDVTIVANVDDWLVAHLFPNCVHSTTAFLITIFIP